MCKWQKSFTSRLEQRTDEELALLARDGDREAEELLVARYHRLVRTCARPYFLAGGDSEDLTQEGMLGLLTAIREYDPGEETSFRTYAEVCIHRRILSAIRSASRMKHTPLNYGVSLEDAFGNDADRSDLHSSLSFRRVPEEQVLARESADELLHTYSQCLSTFEVQILRMFLDGLSYREMAEYCGRNEKSVDNAVQRIRRKLAQDTKLGDFSKS